MNNSQLFQKQNFVFFGTTIKQEHQPLSVIELPVHIIIPVSLNIWANLSQCSREMQDIQDICRQSVKRVQ